MKEGVPPLVEVVSMAQFPEHIVMGLPRDTVKPGLTVIFGTDALAVQAFASVTVTLYTPELEGVELGTVGFCEVLS